MDLEDCTDEERRAIAALERASQALAADTDAAELRRPLDEVLATMDRMTASDRESAVMAAREREQQ